MYYVHPNTKLTITMVKRFVIFPLTLLLSVNLLIPRSFAQEASKPETTSPPPILSSLLTQTVIFIYQDETPQNATDLVPGRILGTAFIVGVPQPGRPTMAFPFIVTAKHVIADRSKVLGRYTQKSGTPFYVQYDLNSLRESGDLWEYPNDKGVDIVVFRTLFYDNAKILPFPVDLIASKETYIREHIGVSDRIMIPCLMQNFPGITQNYPIFRDGSIALIPEEPVSFKWKLGSMTIETTQPIIFVNSFLNERFSGAPAFFWPGFRMVGGQPTFGGKPWLIGIVHGFFPQLRQVIDKEGEDVVLIKPSNEPPNFPGQIKPPRKVSVFSQENSGTGLLFPSWRLLDIIQSDVVKKRIQQLTDEGNKTKPTEKKN